MSILENAHFEFDFEYLNDRLNELKTIKETRDFTDEENADYLTIYDYFNNDIYEQSKKPNVFNVRKHLNTCINDFNYFASDTQKEYLKNIPCNTGLIDFKYEDCFDIKQKVLSYDKQEFLLRKVFNFNEISQEMINYMLDENNHSFSYKRGNNNFFTKINNKPHMSIDKVDNIGGFLNLIHEFGHFYDYLTRSEEYNSDKKTLLYDEVFSLFFELKAVYELRKNNIIDDREASMLFTHIQETNMDNYIFVYTAMTSDFHFYKIKDLLNDLKTKDNKLHYIRYYLYQLTNLTLRERKDFCNLEYPFPEIAEYNFSYLLALNLLYISNNDLNKALDYLHKINNCLNINNEKDILTTIYCDKDTIIETVNKHNKEKILKRNN